MPKFRLRHLCWIVVVVSLLALWYASRRTEPVRTRPAVSVGGRQEVRDTAARSNSSMVEAGTEEHGRSGEAAIGDSSSVVSERSRIDVMVGDWTGHASGAVGDAEATPIEGGNRAGGGPEYLPSPALVWVPPGAFLMGSPESEQDRSSVEGPQTQVIFTQGFWIGRNEVTAAEFQSVMGGGLGNYVGHRLVEYYRGSPNSPVLNVSWASATGFCSRLTELHQRAGKLPDNHVFRLPTEAEWEYGCRAGSTTRFGFGDDPTYALINQYAWVSGNTFPSEHPQPVCTKLPNSWGVHDMHGSAAEWCLDWMGPRYPGGIITNGIAWSASVLPDGGRVVAFRGGDWRTDAAFCRSASRARSIETPGEPRGLVNVGFRLVLAVPCSSGSQGRTHY